MTKKIITSYATFLCMAIAMVGITTAHASEVTGTLSSDTSSDMGTTGNIGGTVESENGGSSSGGSSRGSRGGSGSLANAPSGSVLAASTDTTPTPGFPNAGALPDVGSVDQTLWSAVKTFFRNMFSF